MNPSARPQTSRNRDRALARVTSITTQTALVASIATVGFGGLAAITYSGTPAAAGSDSTNVNGTTNNSSNGTTSGSTVTNPFTGLQATQPPRTSTRQKARVTSGGSH